jgi:hypothetical protein
MKMKILRSDSIMTSNNEKKIIILGGKEISCRDGEKRMVYTARLKHKDKIRKLTPMFNELFVIDNCFDLSNGIKGMEYTDKAYNALLEILVLAFDEKYTKEQIEGFLDFSIVKEILRVYYGFEVNN